MYFPVESLVTGCILFHHTLLELALSPPLPVGIRNEQAKQWGLMGLALFYTRTPWNSQHCPAG